MYSELNKVITCRYSLSSISAIYLKTADSFYVGFVKEKNTSDIFSPRLTHEFARAIKITRIKNLGKFDI